MQILDLIQAIPSDTEDLVEKAYQTSGRLVREALRVETALRLRSGLKHEEGDEPEDRDYRVVVRMDQIGFSEQVGEMMIPPEHELAARLAPIRQHLVLIRDSGRQAGPVLDSHGHEIDRTIGLGHLIGAVGASVELAERLLRLIDSFDLGSPLDRRGIRQERAGSPRGHRPVLHRPDRCAAGWPCPGHPASVRTAPGAPAPGLPGPPGVGRIPVAGSRPGRLDHHAAPWTMHLCRARSRAERAARSVRSAPFRRATPAADPAGVVRLLGGWLMATPELSSLLSMPEGQYFERKSLWHGPPGGKRLRDRREVRDEIAYHVAAFANADGGSLLLGVEDDGTPTGHGFPAEAIQDFLAVPERRLTPPLSAGMVISSGAHELLLFTVEAAPQAVMVVGDGFPYRVDDRVVPMGEVAINAIKQQGLVESAEARSAGERTIADLDPALILKAAAGGGLAGCTPEDYLVARRLADRRGTGLHLRRAAVLLFTREPWLIDHPNAGVRIFRVRGTERLLGARHNVQELPRIEGNLPTVINRTHQALSGLIQRSARLHDLFFREVPEYPDFAWQEAIVNAVAHRDYGQQGRSTEIWLYEDRLEVQSPGRLVEAVSLDDLRQRRPQHVSRNPRLTRVLTDLSYMRDQGEGIPRMFAEMEGSWLPLPDLATDAHLFTVTLRNTPLLEVGDPAWTRRVEQLPLGIRQKRILVSRAGAAFTSAEYQELNQVDRDLAYRDLRELVKLGLLVSGGGRGRAARYQVVAPAQDLSLPVSRHAVLAERMSRTGAIASADYRAVFGCGRHEATRALSKLISTDVLVREGEGRATRYRPGPSWGKWVAAAGGK